MHPDIGLTRNAVIILFFFFMFIALAAAIQKLRELIKKVVK